MSTATLTTVGGQTFAVGYAGQLASNVTDARIESVLNENATAVDFGDAVCRGTVAAPGALNKGRPTFSSGVVLGLAVRQDSEANTSTAPGVTPVVNYPQNKMVPVLKEGDMWALAAETAAEGDDVLAIVGSSGLGSVQTGATSATRLAVPGCKWKNSVTVGVIGRVTITTA